MDDECTVGSTVPWVAMDVTRSVLVPWIGLCIGIDHGEEVKYLKDPILFRRVQRIPTP